MDDYEKLLLHGNNYKTVRTIDGKIRAVHINSLVGYCHHKIHKGYLNASIMNEHHCKEKHCPYFEKYEELPYWANKKKKIHTHNMIPEITDCVNLCVSQLGLPIMVTSVKKTLDGFNIFYISEDTEDTAEDYIVMTELLEEYYDAKFKMIRIRLPNTTPATFFDYCIYGRGGYVAV